MKFVLIALIVAGVLSWFVFGSRSAAKQASVEAKLKQLQYADESAPQVKPMTNESDSLEPLPQSEAE